MRRRHRGCVRARWATCLPARSQSAASRSFIGHAIEAGAKIDDLADQAGLTAEQFQELAFALRNAGVDQEKLSAAFAMFGRNLSDLNRGTGSLLDFTRRFAPALGEQLKGVTDTSEAFEILVDFLSTLTDKTDQLRVGAGGSGPARLPSLP